MSDKPMKGSCLCRGVTFEITPPILFFQYCHCSRCRKATGTAHATNLFIKAAQLTWTAGEDLVRRREMPEAKYYCTGWCDTCGSSLPWASRNGKYFLVPAGAMDDELEGKPTRNIYWASRGDWYVAPEDLEKHDADPH